MSFAVSHAYSMQPHTSRRALESLVNWYGIRTVERRERNTITLTFEPRVFGGCGSVWDDELIIRRDSTYLRAVEYEGFRPVLLRDGSRPGVLQITFHPFQRPSSSRQDVQEELRLAMADIEAMVQRMKVAASCRYSSFPAIQSYEEPKRWTEKYPPSMLPVTTHVLTPDGLYQLLDRIERLQSEQVPGTQQYLDTDRRIQLMYRWYLCIESLRTGNKALPPLSEDHARSRLSIHQALWALENRNLSPRIVQDLSFTLEAFDRGAYLNHYTIPRLYDSLFSVCRSLCREAERLELFCQTLPMTASSNRRETILSIRAYSAAVQHLHRARNNLTMSGDVTSSREDIGWSDRHDQDCFSHGLGPESCDSELNSASTRWHTTNIRL